MESLESLEITTCRKNINSIIHVLPLFANLTALELFCWNSNIWPVEIYEDQLENIAATCPQLKVLATYGFDLSLAVTAISKILTTMKHAQVISFISSKGLLQLDNNGDTSIDTNIWSLLGVLIDGHLESLLRHLRYKTNPKNTNQILMRAETDPKSWMPATSSSPQWLEATGTHLFYPKDSLSNLHLIKHVQDKFIHQESHPCLNIPDSTNAMKRTCGTHNSSGDNKRSKHVRFST